MTHHDEHKIMRHASIVGAMTAISRIAGLVRELIMAYFFGTGIEQSAFVVAFRIPNLFRRLFGEGALGGAFIPVFSSTLTLDGPEEASRFAARIMALQSCAIGILVALVMLATLAVEPLLAPDSRWRVVLPLMRIMLPYAMLICQAALISGMLNTFKKFAISSLTPVILNLVWIAALLLCPLAGPEPMRRITFISWAILAAGLFQILFQLPALKSCGIRVGFDFSPKAWRDSPRVRKVLLLMAPAALGIGLDQINICIDGWLAYYAATWAPAALEYADRIIYLPLGMFATAFMTVLLPTFSRQAAAADYDGMRLTLERSIRNLTVIVAPTAAALALLALPVVELIYLWKNGRFNAESALYTSRAVMAYAPGLLAFSIQKCLTPAFYGLQDLKTPVKIGSCCILLNFCCNVCAILTLPEGWRHAGMAAATVLSSLVNGILLARVLSKRIDAPRPAQFVPTLLRAVTAAVLMAMAARLVHGLLLNQLAQLGWTLKLAQLGAMAGAVATGCLIYGGLMLLVARADLHELVAGLRHRKKP